MGWNLEGLTAGNSGSGSDGGRCQGWYTFRELYGGRVFQSFVGVGYGDVAESG